jgi:hypothetical protein
MSENHTEHAQEHIHHEAAHGQGPRWITAAALTAASAAVGGGQSSGHLTEATHARIKMSDTWNEYKSKSIKNYVLASEREMLKGLKADVPKGLEDKYAANDAEKADLKKKAEGLNGQADAHLKSHESFERATMMFHIAIAVVAIAVVAKRKEFWWVSMVMNFSH